VSVGELQIVLFHEMNAKDLRLIIGLITAPMVAAVGMCVLTHTYVHFGSAPPPIQWDRLLSEYPVALLVAYVIVLPFAVPIYYILAKFKRATLTAYVGVGLITGLVLSSMAAQLPNAAGIFAIVIITTTLTTLAFYFVLVKDIAIARREQIASPDCTQRNSSMRSP
jgi:hypothetical protein